MAVRFIPHASLLVILCVGTLWVGQARASLAGDAASVLGDAGELHAAVQSSRTLQQVDIQELVCDNGMRVREFLNRDGTVFAVAWSGPAMPDLHRLLGAQFAVYAAALAARDHPGLHRSVRVVTPGLVVESDAHLRGYAGRAYLPAMIPADVSITEIH